MAEFAYRGRSTAGELVTGKLHGGTADAVAGRLITLGITPVEIRNIELKSTLTVNDIWLRMGGGQPTTKDLIMFCRQMYTITRAGLPLLRGLKGLMDTTHNEVLKAALVDMLSSLESGRDLSQSMAVHDKIFTPLFINLIEIGEASGTLETSFQRLYEYLSMEMDIRDKVKAAVRYPIVVMMAIGVALGIITVFVIPNFAPIFKQLGNNIPMPTKIIMGVSGFVVNYWGIVLAAIVATSSGLSFWKKTEAGRLKWDRWMLAVPVTGAIVRNAAMSRITRSLSVSISAGLPINQTLRTVSGSIGNAWLGQKLDGLGAGIERGGSLSSTARTSGLFTPLVLQMIALGEETGALPELMDEASEYYRREVDYDLDNLSAALEPILIVSVGAIVLVLALGVFLPMWDMIARAKAG